MGHTEVCKQTFMARWNVGGSPLGNWTPCPKLPSSSFKNYCRICQMEEGGHFYMLCLILDFFKSYPVLGSTKLCHKHNLLVTQSFRIWLLSSHYASGCCPRAEAVMGGTTDKHLRVGVEGRTQSRKQRPEQVRLADVWGQALGEELSR